MHTVALTPMFLNQAKREGMADKDISDIVNVLADNPNAGDLMAGTGGARKLRHAGRGKGKSGGYRTIHYFGGDDVPVFLLSVYGKGTADNLTKAERNELAKILPKMADAYKKSASQAKAKFGYK
ncbi:MAG: type II toxin-antitoxin system RelE/ParE family toxin [Rhodobacteraceae bacterium]|nr:type II toxin-antitoxin system RelE/ParE family toxin [Paracoccaceae bacterium]